MSDELPRPEDHPEELFIMCLHDGETASENAEAIASWHVKTSEELRTVKEVLDNLISYDDYFEEAMWTLVRAKMNPVITPEQVERTASNAMRDMTDETEHDWWHPEPNSGLVCKKCELAHKFWSGQPCPVDSK
ncbi:hypothetical protein GCM10010423_64800 [Streptomyces levis]|uniref:Uncharacterized protein n=1 Tax=Streptomyces levis TaxID=285566 RepID=A0ABP6BBS0_9ACTN